MTKLQLLFARFFNEIAILTFVPFLKLLTCENIHFQNSRKGKCCFKKHAHV